MTGHILLAFLLFGPGEKCLFQFGHLSAGWKNKQAYMVMLMGQLFDAVRESVSALEAAECYGLQVNRHGKALCPWHNDHHPSLSFKGQRCKCFSCGFGGSSIDLTARLLDLSPVEAAQRLNIDFRLGVDIAAIRPTEPTKWERRRQYEEWKRQRYHELYAIRATSKEVIDGFTQITAEGSMEFDNALQSYAQALDVLELLDSITFDDYERRLNDERNSSSVRAKINP
jgi:hypothetical protein